ncbi:MAG: hypothetical protein F4W68_00845 [Cenarchaeum sp. SB0661_bin_35]|nr:hypothetical protein [Cenarchaeum sp. SB0667_bin_13]MXZ92968.1 hypothetical protein [Cenarchaeum sp. SB0666_bin_15]MYB46590.1 hypothetical protein [Cenarchaeum sp. SB0662_bin_33]MYC79044.1 hypothetical protein [Cenarchaeum sp. SB0661_bin_35]MYD58808.1 hypothetical protein [Cenarchaeum sp. SB0678_bin_8]MYI52110.1 hypothetical protein [Cenarchaeum sp. SB0673_bin_9]MYJ28380.1 hypothetical protein [Cenarchaeum sp. SB0672_bin_9]
MMPGIGLMKRRLEKEEDAIALAVSGVAKRYNIDPSQPETLETKYHTDAGDWYVALGWNDMRAVVRMDSVLAQITDIKKIPKDKET